MSKLTLVTAFTDMYPKRSELIDELKKLIETQVNLCIFTDAVNYLHIQEIIGESKWVKLMPSFEPSDLKYFTHRSHETYERMALQCNKLNFVRLCINENPF